MIGRDSKCGVCDFPFLGARITGHKETPMGARTGNRLERNEPIACELIVDETKCIYVYLCGYTVRRSYSQRKEFVGMTGRLRLISV